MERINLSGALAAVGMEDADLGAERLEQALGLESQEPRIGPFPQRTVEHQDAWLVLQVAGGQAKEFGYLEGVGAYVG